MEQAAFYNAEECPGAGVAQCTNAFSDRYTPAGASIPVTSTVRVRKSVCAFVKDFGSKFASLGEIGLFKNCKVEKVY